MAITSGNHETHKKICRLIDSSRINESFKAINSELSGKPNLVKLSDKLKNAEDNYKYMLHYLTEGFKDESRDRIMAETKRILREANDLCLREALLTDSPDIYSSTRRMINLRKSNLKELIQLYLEIRNSPEAQSSESEIISNRELEVMSDIFDFVWTIFGSEPEVYENLFEVFKDRSMPDYLKSVLLSALTLGGLRYFDAKAFELLLDICETEETPLLKSKSAVGFMLIALKHFDRIANDQELSSRLSFMAANPEMQNDIKEVVVNLIKAYDTKRVTSKMKDELIPGLMKIQPEIMEKFKNLSSDSDNFLSDVNPEWEELIESSGLSDKLQELNEMQMEGADVMMTTFSNLKGYPFFNRIINWFIPFKINHPDLSDLKELHDSEIVKRLNLIMCESDLYSFFLSLKGMPESHRSRMVSQMENQLKEAEKVLKPEFDDSSKYENSKRIKYAIQDLYRFHKLFKKKEDFDDPFESPLSAFPFETLPWLFGIDNETIRMASDFYFKHGYWQEAAGFLELLDKKEPCLNGNWEKIGYCYQKCANHSKAVEWYKKAELINPDSLWLTKKLAMSLRYLGNYHDSIEYYMRALGNEPDNFHLLMSCGQALLEAGDTSKALEQFYHAEYLKPSHKGALRAIAWCELMNEDFTKARNSYAKLLGTPDCDKTDWLNAGHEAMAEGDFKKAVDYYTKFIEISENKSLNDLILAFRDDSGSLKRINVQTADLRLVVDKIRYNLAADN